MRRVRGSMMDPVGTGPDDVESAVAGFAAAALRGPRLLRLKHGLAWQVKWLEVVQRQARHLTHLGLALPRLMTRPESAREVWDLSNSIQQQWQGLLAQWLQGLTELHQEVEELQLANTMSKQVDQDMNLLQQTFALWSNQATATVRLLENIEVNVAWWVERQADDAPRAPAAAHRALR